MKRWSMIVSKHAIMLVAPKQSALLKKKKELRVGGALKVEKRAFSSNGREDLSERSRQRTSTRRMKSKAQRIAQTAARKERSRQNAQFESLPSPKESSKLIRPNTQRDLRGSKEKNIERDGEIDGTRAQSSSDKMNQHNR